MSLHVTLLSLALAGSPSSAPGPSLCAGLQKAIDAGPEMTAVRQGPGVASTGGSGSRRETRVWNQAVALPGAREVRVRELHELFGGTTFTLTAVFSDKTTGSEPLRSLHADLVSKVEACLGKGWKRREINLAGTSAHVGFLRDKAMVDVTISHEEIDPGEKNAVKQALQLKSWVQLELHYGLWD